MGYFADSAEVDTYIGGVFRAADGHAESGPKMRAADLNLRVLYTDPDTEMWVKMHEPAMEVHTGADEDKADITLMMRADTGDKFWRGEYNLAVGLAKGPVNKILKLVPLTKPLFPMYRELVAEKDASANA
jgi:hypothetical protein